MFKLLTIEVVWEDGLHRTRAGVEGVHICHQEQASVN